MSGYDIAGQLYELKVKTSSPGGLLKWEKLGQSDQLPKRARTNLIIHEETTPPKVFGFAESEASVYKFDFNTALWSNITDQHLDKNAMTYSFFTFKATKSLVVVPFMGPGYAIYNADTETVVSKRGVEVDRLPVSYSGFIFAYMYLMHHYMFYRLERTCFLKSH